MNIDDKIGDIAFQSVNSLYGEVDRSLIQTQKTRKDFVGDLTLVVFPLLKASRKSPEITGAEIGEKIVSDSSEVESYNVVKGFLNLKMRAKFWVECFNDIQSDEAFGCGKETGKSVMIEYSSPNTNKPLHLGHIRNNLLGYSVAKILEANGNKVTKVNLVNDRGIHICKSMIAWIKFGNGETPQSTGLKGDHLVGKYYVAFDKAYKTEIKTLMDEGQSEDDAKRNAPIFLEAQDMLRKWEAKDSEVYSLWETMNGWVYDGFDVTYKTMGVNFDKIYYESKTYLLGKELVNKGLEMGVFHKREDGSVWINLESDGLDEKLLLRADGTSVYMTQDLGTAYERQSEFHFDKMTYVVGNEQNYHFQVLKLILKKLGCQWADNIYHLSYGMVELPEGKMKSREGTVVDADDLMEEMVTTARSMSKELGKLEGLSQVEADDVCTMIGLGALKYFILKVDPKKNMMFDPKESIDFNGNTGPFIQYTHARIRSLLRKAEELKIGYLRVPISTSCLLADKEIEIIQMLNNYEATVAVAGENMSPAMIANYCYDLAKLFNQYYHEFPMMKEEDVQERNKRITISLEVASIIKRGMLLLGIGVPERM
ncbi:MAG: arginine--tRNA ligase [Rikenellaceae bacterium]